MSPLNATLLYLLLWITKLQYDVQMYIMINDEKVLVVEKGTLLFSNLLQLYKQRNRLTNDQCLKRIIDTNNIPKNAQKQSTFSEN